MQIAILAYPGMTALDAIGPYEMLRGLPSAEFRFVWHQPGPIVTDSGVLTLGATHSLTETPAPDIVLVGGSIPATLSTAADERVLDWLRKVHETTSWTASVCSGSLILGAAGILRAGMPRVIGPDSVYWPPSAPIRSGTRESSATAR